MMRASGVLARLRLRAPVGRSVPHGGEVALEVNGGDGVELLFAGVGEHAVPDDARVVDQNVQPAERVDRRLDETLGLRPVGDVRAAGDGFASGGGDLVDDALRCAAATGGRSVKARHRCR